MSEQIEYKGEWFIPDVSKVNLSGTLKITQYKQIILELICPKNSFIKFYNSNRIPFPINIDIICGISQSINITLLNCYSFFPDLFKEPSIVELTPNIAFIGKLFTKVEKTLFNSMAIDISYLDRWVNQYKIDIKEPRNNHIKISYKKPKNIIVFNAKGFKISICHDFCRNITKSGEINLSSKPYLKIETRKERAFDDFMKMSYLFQKFLVLAILEPVYPLSTKGIINDEGFVEIYYALNHDSLEIKSELQNILFTLDKTPKDIKFYFNNFFEKADLLKSVYDIYFGTIYSSTKYVENWFLSLITAIEAFHRRILGGSYQDSEQYLNTLYKKFIEVIPDDIDKDYRQALENKMIYLYEYSLRRRLNELINKLPECIKKSLFIDYNRKDFIDAVITIRNYLIHYEKGKDDKLDFHKIYKLAKRLKMLIHLLLLNEIGFNIEQTEWRKLI